MQYLASYRQVKQGGSIYEAIKNAEMSMETAEERGYTFSELGRMFKKLGILTDSAENNHGLNG